MCGAVQCGPEMCSVAECNPQGELPDHVAAFAALLSGGSAGQNRCWRRPFALQALALR